MRVRVLLLVLATASFSGCDSRAKLDIPESPKDMVDRPQFVQIHAQLQLLEAAHRQHMLKGDRQRSRALHRERILKEAGVTDSAFMATYDWWYNQPEALPGLLEEVQSHLDSLARTSEWN